MANNLFEEPDKTASACDEPGRTTSARGERRQRLAPRNHAMARESQERDAILRNEGFANRSSWTRLQRAEEATMAPAAA